MKKVNKPLLFKKDYSWPMGLLTALIFVVVLLISVGYGANNTELNISGEAIVRVDADIRVTNCSLAGATNGGVENYECSYSKNSLKAGVTLPNLNSTVTYNVTVTNFVDLVMILGSLTNINFNNSDMEYTLSGINIGSLFNGTANTTFQVIFKYKASTTVLPANTSLGSQIQFDFAENSYILTVNANGGTWSGTTPQTIAHASTTTINNPTRAGYTFSGWTVSGAGSSMNGTTFTMGTADTTITANWIQITHSLTVNANGGTWSGTTPQTIAEGGTVTINDPTRANYTFTGWTLSGSGSSINGTTFTMGTVDASLTANWLYYQELLVGNYPTLISGMIPVTFDSSTRVWKKADLTTAWYDYSSGVGMWANMVLVSSANRNTYLNAASGTTIPFANIVGMYVWIPRYSYAKMGTWGNGGTASTSPGSMTIKFVNTSTDETGDAAYTSGEPTSSDWKTHPAFWWDLDNDQVKDSNEHKKGFWFAKFEASPSTTCTAGTTVGAGCDITTLYPLVKPNVASWRGIRMSTAYTNITTYMTGANGNTYYGLPNDSSFETNLPTNSDWGAVAYLTQSIYGKYGNSNFSTIALKEVYNNNASTPTSGRSGGRPGYASGYTVAAGCFDYDGYIRTNNVACNPAGNFSGTVGQILSGADIYLAYGASTTGTVYGIYDMAGGVNEWIMADYYSTTTSPYNYSGYNATSNTGFNGMFGQTGGPLTTGVAWPQFRFYDRHTSTTFATACGGAICYGQAHSEVYSTTGWYSDTNGSGLTTGYVTFARGGIYNSAAASGIFHATRSYGTQTTTIGFRTTIKTLN